MNRNLMLAVSLVLSSGAPALAQDCPIKPWVDRVNTQIERVKVSPSGSVSGLAAVSFQRSVNGRAINIQSRTADPILADAARRTVRRLRDLPPLPEGVATGQRITFKLLVGDGSFGKFERNYASMLASANADNEKFATLHRPNQLALNTSR